MPKFIVDSNFFIEAHRVNYPIDIATGFWNKVKDLAEKGVLISIDKVKEELYDHNDELELWCKENIPVGFFKDSTEALIYYGTISQWAITNKNGYTPGAVNF